MEIDIYSAEVVKCDWCRQDVERKKTKYWVTGSRLCPDCYKEAEDGQNKFMEEFRREMNRGTFFGLDSKEKDKGY